MLTNRFVFFILQQDQVVQNSQQPGQRAAGTTCGTMIVNHGSAGFFISDEGVYRHEAKRFDGRSEKQRGQKGDLGGFCLECIVNFF